MRQTWYGVDVSGTEPLRPGGGETLATLHSLAASGQIVHVFDDVFLPADMVSRRPLRVAVLAEVIPAHAVVTGQAAAWVWGGPLPTTVRVLLPLGSSRRLRPGILTSQDRRLPQEHIESFPSREDRVLQVTTPPRTLLELVALEDLGDPATSAAVDWLLENLVEPREVEEILPVKHTTPGAVELRRRVAQVLATD